MESSLQDRGTGEQSAAGTRGGDGHVCVCGVGGGGENTHSVTEHVSGGLCSDMVSLSRCQCTVQHIQSLGAHSVYLQCKSSHQRQLCWLQLRACIQFCPALTAAAAAAATRCGMKIDMSPFYYLVERGVDPIAAYQRTYKNIMKDIEFRTWYRGQPLGDAGAELMLLLLSPEVYITNTAAEVNTPQQLVYFNHHDCMCWLAYSTSRQI